MAVGGQGGGVLTNWIADLATQADYAVQMTSVAGVAQRTGATIYYVEMARKSERPPVFALSPSPGDVDILIASELMEAGRAIIRGFVTEDRTTLIASTHRVLAISEKQHPADGRSESEKVIRQFEKTALKTVCFDMQAIADQAGSMVSASLFGALARSQALPFSPDAFEAVIKSTGLSVNQSLAAFRAALNYQQESASLPGSVSDPLHSAMPVSGPDNLLQQWAALEARVSKLPSSLHPMTIAGLKRIVDYQDIDYGTQYLDRLDRFVAVDHADAHYTLSNTAAKYLANAMCYDDIIRVADLKTRHSRDERLKREQQAQSQNVLRVTEYFHPRAEEFCATLPASLGARLENSPRMFALLQRVLNRGRKIRTDRIAGFTLLWTIAGLKRYRRNLLRHRYESRHLESLVERSLNTAAEDYQLAIEVLKCQRLIKGYSDTHARGQSKFHQVVAAGFRQPQKDRAQWIRKLRHAALQDEAGEQLELLLQTDDA
jgi:indolepyruvate ferredoxin oxidoreductase beta subunit